MHISLSSKVNFDIYI